MFSNNCKGNYKLIPMNLSFKVIIRFLFSILGQTQPKMVYKIEIFLLLLPLLVVSLLLWVFQTTPRSRSKQTENDTAAILTGLSNNRNISDRVREPSIKFENLLFSPYLKTDVAAMS